MTRAHCYTAWFLYGLIGAVFLVLATAFPAAYVRMTYEDLYGEWLQTWLFVAVLVLAVPLARRRWRYRWCFALLAVAAFAARSVNRSGAVWGFVLGSALYGLAGWRGSTMLALFFVLGTAATKTD